MNLESLIGVVKPLLVEADRIDGEIAAMLDEGVKTGDVRSGVEKSVALRSTRDELREMAAMRLRLGVAEYEAQGEPFPCHTDTVEGCVRMMERTLAARAKNADRARTAQEADRAKAHAREEAERARAAEQAEAARQQEAAKARTASALQANVRRKAEARAIVDRAAAELEHLAAQHRARGA